MKEKKFTSLYLSETITPIIICSLFIILNLVFFFRLLDGAPTINASSLLDLVPIPIFLGVILLVVLYMLCRFITLNDAGVTYKDLKYSYHIPWEEVKYVKITLNSNGKLGRGSYIIIATAQYSLQYTDFRACRDGFIVFRYREPIIDYIKHHYDGEIFKAVPSK